MLFEGKSFKKGDLPLFSISMILMEMTMSTQKSIILRKISEEL